MRILRIKELRIVLRLKESNSRGLFQVYDYKTFSEISLPKEKALEVRKIMFGLLNEVEKAKNLIELLKPYGKPASQIIAKLRDASPLGEKVQTNNSLSFN